MIRHNNIHRLILEGEITRGMLRMDWLTNIKEWSGMGYKDLVRLVQDQEQWIKTYDDDDVDDDDDDDNDDKLLSAHISENAFVHNPSRSRFFSVIPLSCDSRFICDSLTHFTMWHT